MLELGSAKRTKYDLDEDSSQENNTGYSPSHPGVQYGTQEQELLKRYRRHSASKAPPHPLTESNSTNHSKNKEKRRKSLEEGEVISDEEGEVDEEEEEDDFPENHTFVWCSF